METELKELHEIVKTAKDRRGISTAELGRRCNIHPELLRRSLVGARPFKAEEFIALCNELELSIVDFVPVADKDSYDTSI